MPLSSRRGHMRSCSQLHDGKLAMYGNRTLTAFVRGYLIVLNMELDMRTKGLMSRHLEDLMEDSDSTAGPGYELFMLPGSTRWSRAEAPGVTHPVSYGYGETWSGMLLSRSTPQPCLHWQEPIKSHPSPSRSTMPHLALLNMTISTRGSVSLMLITQIFNTSARIV